MQCSQRKSPLLLSFVQAPPSRSDVHSAAPTILRHPTFVVMQRAEGSADAHASAAAVGVAEPCFPQPADGASSLTVCGLVPGCSYRFRVRMHTGGDSGATVDWSEWSEVTSRNGCIDATAHYSMRPQPRTFTPQCERNLRMASHLSPNGICLFVSLFGYRCGL